MFKNNIMKKSIVFASTVAITAGGLGVAPQAMASGGQPGPTGIVWGNDQSQEGAYHVHTHDGQVLTGFCIDPGLKYPNQDPGTKYGDPVEWGGQLNREDLKRMTLALYLGKMVIEKPNEVKTVVGIFGNIDQAIKDASGAFNNSPLAGTPAKQIVDSLLANPDLVEVRKFGNALRGASNDDVAEAVAGVVHRIGGDLDATNKNNTWGNRVDTLRPKAREIYEAIMSAGPRIPQLLLDQSQTRLYVRNPQDGGFQRMLVVSDVKIPDLPIGNIKFTVPKISIPNVPSSTPGITVKSETPPPTTDSSTGVTTTPSTHTTTPSVPTTKTTATDERKPDEKTVEIRTSAGTKEQNFLEIGRDVTDTVYFKGLEVGKTYVLKAEMMDSETGKPTGNVGETKFVAEATTGQVDVPIKVKNVDAAKQTVFEALYVEGEDKAIAEHKDLKDNSQIVGRSASNPEIRTSASSNTGNYIQSGTVVTDNVSYKGLIPGKEYRLEARLICKATSQDTGASQSVTFKPETADGVQPVENIAITDPDCLQQVAFEKLYDDKGALVASHEDINDAAQTVGGTETAGKKKKKKEAPASESKAPESQKPAPAPAQHQEQHQNQAPAPAVGNGSGNAPETRGVVNAVPSGNSNVRGFNIFNR